MRRCCPRTARPAPGTPSPPRRQHPAKESPCPRSNTATQLPARWARRVPSPPTGRPSPARSAPAIPQSLDWKRAVVLRQSAARRRQSQQKLDSPLSQTPPRRAPTIKHQPPPRTVTAMHDAPASRVFRDAWRGPPSPPRAARPRAGGVPFGFRRAG